MNSTETVALRNRVYRDDTPADQRDDISPTGSWGGHDGIPASGRQTAAIIGTCICGVLLLAGLAYLVWAGRHGMPWQ
jgi:hypothetical protein